MPSINYFAVLLAAVAAFVIGFLAHGPVAGKLWMRLANVHMTGNEKISDMFGKMAWNFLVNVVTAYALAVVYFLFSLSSLGSESAIWNGIVSGLLVWFGFLITATSIDVIWMGKSFKLWFFEVCSSLIVMLAMGVIIAVLK